MLRPPAVDVQRLPPLLPFRYPKTRIQVFTHRSFYARPTAVFEDPPHDIAPDNEVLEYVGDSVLSMAVVTLVRNNYRMSIKAISKTMALLHSFFLQLDCGWGLMLYVAAWSACSEWY